MGGVSWRSGPASAVVATTHLSVAVLDTGELEHALGSRSSDDASAARGRDEPAHDRGRLAGDLYAGVGGGSEEGKVSDGNDEDRA